MSNPRANRFVYLAHPPRVDCGKRRRNTPDDADHSLETRAGGPPPQMPPPRGNGSLTGSSHSLTAGLSSENTSIRNSGGEYTCSVTRSAPPACRLEIWWVSSSALAQMFPDRRSRELTGKTMPLGARVNRVSVATPRNTLTPQCDPRWLWM